MAGAAPAPCAGVRRARSGRVQEELAKAIKSGGLREALLLVRVGVCPAARTPPREGIAGPPLGAGRERLCQARGAEVEGG